MAANGAEPAALLEARGISKYFGSITALADVNFALRRGEVLGVVGDNGAGKSTLMKILSGLYKPSAGEILFDGRPVQFGSPRDARGIGIEMVYQDLALAGNMPIHENIYLGREPGRKLGGLTIVDARASRAMASEHLARLHIEVKSVDQNVEELSGGQQQAVAIARATAFDARIVIMDEPTAALAIKEVGKVLDLIRRLKEHGVSVILISHRMDDVFYVCDRVMALFHGRNFADAEIGATNRNEVIGWIMGTKGHSAALAHDRVQWMASTDLTARQVNVSRFLERYGILLVVVAMMALLYALQPDVFLTPRNLINILKQIAMNALLAIGMYLVILTAGIDLSVGSVLALAMMVLTMADVAGLPWPLVLLLGPAVGLAMGVVNGLGLTLLRLPHPFIMTLGTLNVARGLTNLISDGRPISGLSDPVKFLGAAQIPLPFLGPFGALPISAIVLVVVYGGVAYFLRKTNVGRHVVAVGGNPQAARVSGINVNGILVLVYALSGFFAGLAALLLAGRTNSGFPNAGIGAELDAIAAVIIGGASFFGGRGTVLGVFAGVLIMGLLRNGLNLMNVSVFWQQLLIGVIIIAAVYVDVLRRRAAVRR